MISVESTGGVSSWASVFNLGNCAIGAGILSFPFAIHSAGLLGGVLLCLLVAVVEGSTLRILMCQSTKFRAESYQGLVHLVLGPAYSEFMAWIICVYLFGSCVAYLIIVGDTFAPLALEYVLDPLSLPLWLADRRFIIVLCGLSIILPLSLQRTMGALAGTSSMAVCVMIFTTAVILWECIARLAVSDDPFAGVQLFKLNLAAFRAVPVMVFAYHCHVQAVPIFAELTESPSLLPCGGAPEADVDAPAPHRAAVFRRQLHGMYDVISVGFLECTVMYLAVGVSGYLLFPQGTDSNILNNFETDNSLIQLTRFLVGWAVLFHYPINQHVARTAIYDLAAKYINLDHASHLHIPYPVLATLTLAFFVTTTVTACLVTDLGVVFHIMGGVAGSLLIFVLPGALTLRHAYSKPGPAASALHTVDVVNGDSPVAEPLLSDADGLAAEPVHRALLLEAGRSAAASPIGDCMWLQKYVGACLIAVGFIIMALTMYLTFLDMQGKPAAGSLLTAAASSGVSMTSAAWTAIYAA